MYPEQELHQTDDEVDVSLDPETVEDEGGDLLDLYAESRQRGGPSEDRVSYSAFRHRLWSTMHGFAQTCEPRSRIIVPIFLSFIRYVVLAVLVLDYCFDVMII